MAVSLRLTLALRVIVSVQPDGSGLMLLHLIRELVARRKGGGLIRFIVTFYIFGYKRPVIGEAGCVLNIDLFRRSGDCQGARVCVRERVRERWKERERETESERERERAQPGAVKRARKTTYQKSSEEEITRFE